LNLIYVLQHHRDIQRLLLSSCPNIYGCIPVRKSIIGGKARHHLLYIWRFTEMSNSILHEGCIPRIGEEGLRRYRLLLLRGWRMNV